MASPSREEGRRDQAAAFVARRLPDLHDVEPMGPDDASCLQELRDVLIRNGAVDRFGITLLHDHFELQPDELLVETCEPEIRVLTITPERPEGRAAAERVIETSWRFSESGDVLAGLVCRVGCFVDLKDNHRRTHQRVTR